MAFSLSRPPPGYPGYQRRVGIHGRLQKAPVGGQTGEAPVPSEVAGDRVQYDGPMQRYERANMVHRLVIQMGLMVPSRRPGTRDKLVSRKRDKLVVEVGVYVQQRLALMEYKVKPMDAGEACMIHGARESGIPTAVVSIRGVQNTISIRQPGS